MGEKEKNRKIATNKCYMHFKLNPSFSVYFQKEDRVNLDMFKINSS